MSLILCCVRTSVTKGPSEPSNLVRIEKGEYRLLPKRIRRVYNCRKVWRSCYRHVNAAVMNSLAPATRMLVFVNVYTGHVEQWLVGKNRRRTRETRLGATFSTINTARANPDTASSPVWWEAWVCLCLKAISSLMQTKVNRRYIWVLELVTMCNVVFTYQNFGKPPLKTQF
jgi:hypothetical protein